MIEARNAEGQDEKTRKNSARMKLSTKNRSHEKQAA
jgi:hypothetical protein